MDDLARQRAIRELDESLRLSHIAEQAILDGKPLDCQEVLDFRESQKRVLESLEPVVEDIK